MIRQKTSGKRSLAQRMSFITWRRDERGGVGTISAIFLTVLIGFAGLVIDMGHLFVVRSNLQNVADSASLAAASSLGYGPEEARNQAQIIAHKHAVDGTLVTLASADIELGTWDKETKTFTVLEPAQEQNADSVRVTAQRVQTRDNPVPLFFMGIFGRENSDVGAISVATRAGDCMGGIIGETRITLNSSSVTDSYDSSSGPYSPASAGDNGDVCSCGDIELNSSAVVNGDAGPGMVMRLSLIAPPTSRAQLLAGAARYYPTSSSATSPPTTTTATSWQ